MGSKRINIGLIGLGNVGSGVAKYFSEGNGNQFNVNLKSIAVANPKKKRELGFKLPELTGNPNEIISDPEIDIVVELIGGINPAKNIIVNSIKKGKSVVSANKAVIAKYSKGIFETSLKNKVDFAFEASVGGGIPIIETLSAYRGERINKVMGILNGTTNYILTQMDNGMDFEQALKIAQEKGFAEANHVLDTGGFDARDKLAIISSLIFNTPIQPEQINCEGILGVTSIDIDFAKKFGKDEGGRGFTIKLLAKAVRNSTGSNSNNGSIELSVSPVLISRDHPLASVRDEFNALYIEGELAGPQLFSGKGAGTNPTTSAVIRDIIRVAHNIQNGVTDKLPNLNSRVKLTNPKNISQKGYLRLNLMHKPGSLAQVASIIAKSGLNIEDSIQRKRFKEIQRGQTFIPDIITFEKAERKTIDSVLRKLEKSGRVINKPFFLGFED